MSAFTDYMTKAYVGFVNLAVMYSNQLQLGEPDCLLRNKIIILSWYLDALPQLNNSTCITSDEVETISQHINELLCNADIGTIDGTTIPALPGTTMSGTISTTTSPISAAWNTTIGTTPKRIAFENQGVPITLGTSGNDYGMSYILINSGGFVITDVLITDRDSTGFTATAYEENVHFEGTATLI